MLDNSCREYLFTCDFFLVTAAAAFDLFSSIFGKTIAMLMVSLHLLSVHVRHPGVVQTLESPDKRRRSWKTLVKSWNSKVVVLEILLSGE